MDNPNSLFKQIDVIPWMWPIWWTMIVPNPDYVPPRNLSNGLVNCTETTVHNNFSTPKVKNTSATATAKVLQLKIMPAHKEGNWKTITNAADKRASYQSRENWWNKK